jgi:hypothetical protein
MRWNRARFATVWRMQHSPSPKRARVVINKAWAIAVAVVLVATNARADDNAKSPASAARTTTSKTQTIDWSKVSPSAWQTPDRTKDFRFNKPPTLQPDEQQQMDGLKVGNGYVRTRTDKMLTSPTALQSNCPGGVVDSDNDQCAYGSPYRNLGKQSTSAPTPNRFTPGEVVQVRKPFFGLSISTPLQ